MTTRTAPISIGRQCTIDPTARLEPSGGFIRIGRRVGIGPNCVLYGHGGLTIGEFVGIAANTVIIPANHSFDDLEVPIFDQPETREGIVIESNVWIGANVTILDGVTIGTGSVIGAGSVVTRSIPPMAVAYGAPATVRRFRT